MSGRVTRRRALIGGAGVVVLAGTGWWGRYALGDTFEHHVADVLGVDLKLASELTSSLRDEIGDYESRAIAFLLATTSPSQDVMPADVRREAIEAFVGALVGMQSGLVTPFVLAGLRQSGRYVPCSVLTRG